MAEIHPVDAAQIKETKRRNAAWWQAREDLRDLAHHLRSCKYCGETDVLECHKGGKELWLKCFPNEVTAKQRRKCRMTLVQRLRVLGGAAGHDPNVHDDAADRINELEMALRSLLAEMEASGHVGLHLDDPSVIRASTLLNPPQSDAAGDAPR